MKTLFTTLFVLVAGILLAQPSLSFQRCYGGTGSETSKKMYDFGNSFLVFGETTSNDGDVSGNHGGSDIWVFRNDNTGAIVWQKCFGGTGNETLEAVYPRNDGGYIMVGTTTSNDGDVSGNAGGSDIWVVKIDDAGNLLWQNSIGGSLNEPGLNNQLPYFSGYDSYTDEIVIYINSSSTDGEMTGNLGGKDIRTVRINSLENLSIQNTLSSVNNDYLADGWDIGGHILPVYADSLNTWIGTNTYPRIVYDYEQYSRTADGGYLVYWEAFGDFRCDKYDNTNSFQGDFGYYPGMFCNTVLNAWQVNGAPGGFQIYLETSFFGCAGPAPYDDFSTKIYLNTAGDAYDIFSECGYSVSSNGSVTNYGPCVYPTSFSLSGFDVAIEGGFVRFSALSNSVSVEKRNSSQALEWTKNLGPANYTSYVQRPDTSYWILGYTNANTGDVFGNHGSDDIWLTSLHRPQNTISGGVWEDINLSGTIDAGDQPVNNFLMTAQTSPSNLGYAITQANGQYEFRVGAGNYVISTPNMPLYHTLQPATDTASFSNNNENIDSLHNFLLVPTPNIQDLRISLTALASPQPGFDRSYDMTYKNVGTQSSNATIRYYFNGSESFQSAIPVPDTLNGTYASWHINNIVPAQNGSISLITQTYTGSLGGITTSVAEIYPFANEQHIADNTDSISATIVGSFDPNDKLVSPVSNPTKSTFIANGEYLTYTVRFQNTGTAPATTLVIKDSLSNLLEINTLEVLASSHDFVATVEGNNKLIITYNNIMLPDSGANYLGSQGFIKYRIKPINNIGYCEAVKNKAAIYFDFNAPIITNEVSTLFLPDAPTLSYSLALGDSACRYNQILFTCSNPLSGFQNTWNSNIGTINTYNGGTITSNQVSYWANVIGNAQVNLSQSIANIPGCVVHAMPAEFQVMPTPSSYIMQSSYNTTLCEGQVLTLTVNNTYNNNMQCSYTWLQNGGAVGTDTFYQISQLAQTGVYSLSTINEYGCIQLSGGGSYTTVTVNPSPTVSIAALGSTEICTGDTVSFIATATPGVTYQWKKNNISLSGATTSTYNAAVSGNYTVIAKNSYNCRDTSNIIALTVNPLPTSYITNSSSLTLCDGNSVTLNANSQAGASYIWNESGTPIIGATNSSYQATQSGSYTVTATDSNTCSRTSIAKVVTVNPSPVVSTAIMGNTTLCQGDTVLLIANATNGTTFQWKKNNTNVSGATNDSLFVTTNGNYWVVVNNAFNCKDTSSLTNVVVNPLPTVTLSNAGTLTVCDGNSVTLTANVVAGYSYIWNESGTPIIGATNSSYQATQSGAYTVTATDSNSCSKTSTAKVVTVNPSPVVSTAIIGDTTLCQGDTVLLIANATNATTFQWKKNNTNVSGATNDSLFVTTNGNYWVVVNNAFNCKDTSSLTNVVVNPLPTVTLSNAGTLTVCDGNSVILNANVVAGYSYIWNESGTPIIGATNSSYQAIQSGSYTVTAIDSNSCSKTSTAKIVTVNPSPVVSTAIIGDTTLCQGDTVLLIANATNGVSYQWEKNNTNVSGATNDSLLVTTSGNYQVVVNNTFNCKDTSSLTNVVVNPLPSVPVISQNGNTLNTTNTATSYQWYLNGNVINGATANSYTPTQNGTYSVVVANAQGCENSSANFVVSTLALENGNTINDILVYPNPAQTELFISTQNHAQMIANISLIDIAGKAVYQIATNQAQTKIALGNLAEGVYLLHIETEKGIFTEKIMVKR